MSSFAKPENALKRAEELINVDRNKMHCKHFMTFSPQGDTEHGKRRLKGEVIKHFMHLSTERAEQARAQAQALEEALDVEDLEADKRPEDLMLSYVSGEKGKDRSDRELVTPWFKFLWETYRTVLEILRNNSKLEALYAMTAHRAFQFCKQYKRTTEFRRLCEIIRNHLANLNKYRDQRDRPDLSAPESLQLYIDTRFEQLKVATELELWQEAFRSIEDIHGLMCMVKKTPKSSLMAVYYAKLTEIFWISGSHLYHAYAWFRLFLLQKSFNKNLSQKDLQLVASSVVLAALSVTPYGHTHSASHLDIENEKERNLRMANLIGFNLESKLESKEMLSRSSLLSELVAKGVMSCVIPEVKDLYHLLEHEFFPLDLTSKVQPLLTKLSKFGGKLLSAPSVPEVQLSQYVPLMEKLTTLRLLQQVSQVYQMMKIESLSIMIPFFDFSVVEKISVEAVKHKFVALKIDHMKGVVVFDNMGIESQNLRDHLTILAETLNKARTMIYPPPRNASKLGELLPILAEVVDKEHKRLLARKSLIEKRKEDEERKLLEKERMEESKRLELQKITEEAERKRLASEYEERKNERIRREIEERELAEAQALLQEAAQRIKWKGKKPVIEGEKKLTKQSVMELTLNEQLRERQEMEKKLQKLAKTMDYLERAKREEAAPLVEAAYQQCLVEERVLNESEQQQEIELSRQRHDTELKEKERLVRIMSNKEIFQERVVSRRQEEFTRLRREREERISQILLSRRQEREKMRKLKYYLSLEEERLRKLHEEEEAQKHEEAERQRKEQAERKAKLDEIAEKQRQRERELEEKEKQRREALLRRSTEGPLKPSESPAVARPPVLGSPVPAAAAPGPGKYVPRFRRDRTESSLQALSPEPDRWGGSRPDDRVSQDGDKWGSSRQDDRMPQAGGKWRSDDRRSSGGSSFGGGGGSRSGSTWS
ncbi:Eukaryotic translation initiation factor 3 subunit A [Morella rubra]|uniref:Eukaryotic translation initiation factor 3 subunit A n=1 Tax=Morella rubra TaxID=262757 RepID=A0A6A1VWS8_9ROSI|nr:Eukaryotic translation initiation factor 3 subunit A [Morella rubra]